PMNRLLQGDVGSGKTVVALTSLLAAIGSGYQAALMAPTEILAQQHYLRMKEFLSSLNVQPFLLISELQQKEKERIKNEIKGGTVKLVIGTHALIQKEVQFHKLGIVVIDEQHRFGVMQRATLRSKGKCPDVLVMTATPIPRTLALTCYGDLDVSVIDELPPGRKSVITRWISENKRRWVYQFVSSQIKEGRQAYFVYPLIEESEEINLRAAEDMVGRLRKDIFPQFKVELLHGRMRREEKEFVMKHFSQGNIDIMVCTTVIEVGIDVPNATIMVIENAERFGMAQLHQLRGRVGRGGAQSYCFLLTGNKISEEAVKRMKVMCKTNDGFQIAEEDLKLRGPGQFFGTRQWGELDLKIANLLRDQRMLNLARREAFNLVREDPLLYNHPLLKKAIKMRFPYQWELAKVG
ncbi:ATP-dependent DNA helicase RecG, partial [Candidatus Aerophobetes bacterium]|nr:ATP-dependent DNA helicase RecG [Candidatus Aerophobetes bacterium]